MLPAKQQILNQMAEASKIYLKLLEESEHSDLSDLPVGTSQIVTMFFDLIYRFAPPESAFRTQADLIAKTHGTHFHMQHKKLFGIITALHSAYQNDYLQSVAQLIHAEVFTDFMEMSEHLLSEGYKDAAAVIAGGTLEEGIRKLCTNNGVPIVDANSKYRKCSQMNDDLMKNGILNKLEHKNIIALLDLRNNAAHGNYSKYDNAQVELYLKGIQDFLVRHSA